MRLEATIPDPQAEAADKVAEELGLTRSQLVQEAVSLFIKAAMEIRKGHRLAVIHRDTRAQLVELTSPAFTQLEWVATGGTIDLSPAAAERAAAILAKPPAPTSALKRALKKRR